ncbi:MAG TPA: EAL domain-containing protein [Castellaniella sp.]|uniref:putative bifunctional diguanylate cyclase/phosphodiesterase n=1 Tax=Castellaniella sp. TaxID=1955812 RepID=UPI002EF4CC7A
MSPIVEEDRQILDSSSDAFVGMDAQGLITEWNRAAETMFGWDRSEALGQRVSDTIVPAGHRRAHENGFRHYLSTGKARSIGEPCLVSAVRRDGSEFPVELTRWTLERSGVTQFYSFIRDVTERERRKQLLEKQAYYDDLTGLPNRRLLLARLETLLVRVDGHSAAVEEGLATLFVDLDHFKRINDSLGHSAGDRVLVLVSERLRSAVRPADIVGRLSGDEFLVLCPGVTTFDDACSIADRIFAAIAPAVDLGTDSVFLTASIGVALASQDDDAETLLGAADNAMYHAKVDGRGHSVLFDPEMRREISSRLRLENELRVALAERQLRVYYQPIVSADGAGVVAAEALLRWEHPERGLLLPAEFIPVAEESGLIVSIGQWVFEEVCRHARDWIAAVRSDVQLYLSVNLSARQLAQADIVTMVQRTLAEAALDASRVQFGFEVTESVVMRDPVATADVLRQLRSLGAHLSIDDFGTGYSSLAYLKNLPVDTLKIDQSFIAKVAESAVDFSIVKAITDLARALSLTVVAEGVETQPQAEAVQQAGVDLIQGFLYWRPQPLDALIRRFGGSPSSPTTGGEARGHTR